jgi:hypothetical protein
MALWQCGSWAARGTRREWTGESGTVGRLGRLGREEREPRPTGIERWFGRGAWKRGRVDSPIPYEVAIQPASDRGVLGACLCSRYAGNLTWSPAERRGHCKCDPCGGLSMDEEW